MLKGQVFDLQTFNNEAFALIIDKVLNGNCGVEVGCELSHTTNSATIGEGHFVIRGRPLQIISSETVTDITTNGFYSLVCEIDLSKQNTKESFNQAAIKTVYNASNYPTLTQQDITDNGVIYQYEFARFKVESGSITNFTDKRTYINLSSVLDEIRVEYGKVLAELESELAKAKDESIFLTNDTADEKYLSKSEANNYMDSDKILYGANAPSSLENGQVYVQYF